MNTISKTKPTANRDTAPPMTAADIELAIASVDAELGVTKTRLYGNEAGAEEAFADLQRQRSVLAVRLDVARSREQEQQSTLAAAKRAKLEAELQALEGETSLAAQGRFGEEIAGRVLPIFRQLVTVIDDIDVRCGEARRKLGRVRELQRLLRISERVSPGIWTIAAVVGRVRRVIAADRRSRRQLRARAPRGRPRRHRRQHAGGGHRRGAPAMSTPINLLGDLAAALHDLERHGDFDDGSTRVLVRDADAEHEELSPRDAGYRDASVRLRRSGPFLEAVVRLEVPRKGEP